jgi:uncharacterized membrane protein
MEVPLLHSLVLLYGATPHFSFPEGALANEQIVLRWIHFISGIIWIGLLYFFNLIGFRTMKQLDPSVRGKVFLVLMTRAMWWFRWSALATVLAGLRYFWQILIADARNSGHLARAWHWFGWWLLVWIAAYALIYLLQLPSRTIFNSAWVRGIAIGIVVVAASWVVLERNASPSSSNSHLSISVGGGLGLMMLLNAWGVVWRAQKKLIAWTRASVENGTPMPAEADRMARWAFIASRVAFWLSFPMLFFMGAADHYPFLSSIAD